MKLQPQLSAKHVLTHMLHRSLEILQLPQLELAAFILEEVEKNPVLELVSHSKLEPVCAARVTAEEPVYSDLWRQAKEALPGQEKMAAALFAQLDEWGFLQEPSIESEEILAVLKTLDPPGVFAKDLQEAFQLQLERQRKEKTVAYRIVTEGFADFLAGRYAALKKRFRVSAKELQDGIEKISQLKTRPLYSDKLEVVPSIYPDLEIEEGKVSLREEGIPKFRMNEKYLSLRDETMREFAATAKWLYRSVERRKKLILAIGQYLVKKQRLFFEGEAGPVRISAKELAAALGVHESTIFRATAGKYMETPRGMISLRMLISTPANGSVKEVLRRLVEQENSTEPHTDESLMRELAKAGFKVARRTIAKYRKELKISTSSTRSLFQGTVSKEKKRYR